MGTKQTKSLDKNSPPRSDRRTLSLQPVKRSCSIIKCFKFAKGSSFLDFRIESPVPKALMLVTWILLEEGYGLACLAYTLRTLRSAVINEVDP